MTTVYPEQGPQVASASALHSVDHVGAVEIQANTCRKYPWGTLEWALYERLRPAVESFFGIIKDPGKEHTSRAASR